MSNKVYVSSNTAEGTRMQDAYRMLQSPEHAALVAATPGGRSGYGVWTDGAEDARVFPVEDPERVVAVGESLGKQFKQKAVALFREDPHGPDRLHVLTIRESDPEAVHRRLLDHGIEHETILPSPEGLEIHVLDPGAENTRKVEAFAHGAQSHYSHPGHIEFLATK